MVKKVLSFIFLFLVFSFKSPVALAAEEFATSYNVVYDIGLDGVAAVTQKISLRNLTSQYYANQFKITTSATQIFDITASDESGPMETKVDQLGNSTSITVKFNQQVTGLNKVLPWTLQFKSKDFAEKIGKIWEVRAPKIASIPNLESYQLTIQVPQSFGDPTLISPNPKTQTTSFGKILLTFEKEQLQGAGILASFGTKQLFDFDLIFHLENDNIVPAITNIALPPDTAYQDVIYERIEPRPLNVTVDEDGNYLAWFKLSRRQKMDVRVKGLAKLYTSTKAKSPFLSEVQRKKYTQAQPYWEKDNPQITTKLSEILGDNPPEDPKEKVRLIYRYVVNSLKYDSTRLSADIERLGAVTALNNPDSAICMEFTDLFIALARAAEIPARELDGFAYSANPALRPLSLTQDVLHAWPEFFDDNLGWVMVDPTWENTTGGVDYFSRQDLNHFVFVTKGVSSTSPFPAGAYKYAGENSRDVKVIISENDALGKPQIDVEIDSADTILAAFPGKIKVKVANRGNTLNPPSRLSVSARKLRVVGGQDKNLGPVPAFGEANFEFRLRTQSFFDAFEDQIEVVVEGQKFTKEVSVRPFFAFGSVPFLVAGGGAGMIMIYVVILGAFIYRRKFRKK